MISVEGRPAWWAAQATGAALHVLPRGSARDRWTRELLSELYGLSPAEQARHTLGVLRRAPALRAALTVRDRGTEASSAGKSIRCHVSLHRWRIASSEDGSYRFRRCSRCGKEQTWDPPPQWTARSDPGDLHGR
jgi:hypothetical protein